MKTPTLMGEILVLEQTRLSEVGYLSLDKNVSPREGLHCHGRALPSPRWSGAQPSGGRWGCVPCALWKPLLGAAVSRRTAPGGFSRSPAPGVLDNRSNTAAVCADRPYADAHPELVRGCRLQQPCFQIQMPLALEFVFKTGQPNERKL